MVRAHAVQHAQRSREVVILKRAQAERRLTSVKRAPAWKKWFLLSADGSKNLGGYKTRREAVARERAVQYFKHRKKNPYRDEERWKHEGQPIEPAFRHTGEEAKSEGDLKRRLLKPLRDRRERKQYEAAWEAEENPRPFLDRDHDWNEVLIQKGNKRRTRKEIRDYYVENESLIWPYLKGQMMMIILAPKKNEFVLRRKGPDGEYIRLTKLKGIDDPESFEYWINRRVIEFHPVIEPNKRDINKTTTPLVFIDIDPYRTKNKAMNRRLQRYIKNNVSEMKSILRKEFNASPIHVWRSGKQDGGWHVEGNLPRSINVDRVRMRLRSALDAAFKGSKVFTTTIAKPNQIRLDTTLLKAHGSLRAPYSYTVDGEQKLPTNAHNPILVPNPPLAGADIGRFKQAVSGGENRVIQFLTEFPTEAIGRGTAPGGARTAYLIDTDDGVQVLKVDTNNPPYQTLSEIECLLKSKRNPLVPKIYDYDADEGRWIQMELVEGFDHSTIADMGNYRQIFKKLSGIEWVDFDRATRERTILVNAQNKRDLLDALNIDEGNELAIKFLKNLFAVMRKCGIMYHEVSIFENWGVTLDGKRLRILDLGQ